MWPIRHNPFPSSLNPLQLLHEWEELLSPVSLCRLISEHLRTMLLSARHGSKLLMKQLESLKPSFTAAVDSSHGKIWRGVAKGALPVNVLTAPNLCVYCSPEKEDFCSLTLRGYFSKSRVCFALSAPWFQFVEWEFEEAGSHWAPNIDISCPRATPAFQASSVYGLHPHL